MNQQHQREWSGKLMRFFTFDVTFAELCFGVFLLTSAAQMGDNADDCRFYNKTGSV